MAAERRFAKVERLLAQIPTIPMLTRNGSTRPEARVHCRSVRTNSAKERPFRSSSRLIWGPSNVGRSSGIIDWD